MRSKILDKLWEDIESIYDNDDLDIIYRSHFHNRVEYSFKSEDGKIEIRINKSDNIKSGSTHYGYHMGYHMIQDSMGESGRLFESNTYVINIIYNILNPYLREVKINKIIEE